MSQSNNKIIIIQNVRNRLTISLKKQHKTIFKREECGKGYSDIIIVYHHMGSLNNYLLLLLMGFKTHRRGKIMLFAEQNNDSRPRATGPVHMRTCDTFLFPPIKLMVLVR